MVELDDFDGKIGVEVPGPCFGKRLNNSGGAQQVETGLLPTALAKVGDADEWRAAEHEPQPSSTAGADGVMTRSVLVGGGVAPALLPTARPTGCGS